MRKHSTLILFAVLFALSLSAQNSSQQQLSNLLPDPLPAQTVPQSEITFYGPQTLYKYMDGGADAFLLYDFQMLLHQDLRIKDTDLSIDIFDMSRPENAFGMYASERSASYHYISIGTEGYDNEGILNFLQGPYYVKLAAFGPGSKTVLEEFAKAISSRVKTDAAFPATLSLFPSANRKAHSEQFLLKDPLGHPFLAPSYLVRYDLNQQESTLLLSVAADSAEAQGRLKLLSEHFKNTGRCDPAPEFGDGAIRVSNSFEGIAIARAQGHYLVMLINPAAGSETLFKETIQRLQ